MSKKTKHTPGDWRIMPEEEGCEYIRIRGTQLGRLYKIANVLGVVQGEDGNREWAKRQNDEVRANANLMAAAPKLLAFAESVLAAHRAQLPSEAMDLYGGGCGCPQCEAARAAIAAAKGEGER